MNVSGLGAGPPVMALAPARAGGTGFSVPGAGMATAAPSAAAAAPTPTGSLDAMLALQEQTGGADRATPRDRQSKRRGQALLAALAALQHALLADGDAAAALQQMTALLSGPPADEPKLEAVVRSLSLRASIELARRGW